MWQEFKDFAIKGNLIDMAVGIVIGAAFGKIVSSFVGDIVMPIVGYAAGGTDFANMFTVLGGGEYATLAAAEAAGASAVKYGVFINTVIDFLIVALAVFVAVKAIQKMQKAKEEEAGPSELDILMEIRDGLKR